MDVWNRAVAGDSLTQLAAPPRIGGALVFGALAFHFEPRVIYSNPSLKLPLQSGNGYKKFRVACSKDDIEPSEESRQTDDADLKSSVDWDKAWSTFKKIKRQPTLFKIDMEQYVSRKPTRSNYPLSEEVSSFKKIEKKALDPWTDLKFTYAGVGVIVGLFVYMVIIVGPPPT